MRFGQIHQDIINKSATNFEQIGRALGKICRFAGRGDYYSVLAHSMAVGTLALYEDPLLELPGYLHDCSETFTGDPTAPFKTQAQRKMEERVRRAIFETLNISYPSAEIWESIHKHDLDACSAEWDLIGMNKIEDWSDRPIASTLAAELTHYYLGSGAGGWIDGTYVPEYARLCKVALPAWQEAAKQGV